MSFKQLDRKTFWLLSLVVITGLLAVWSVGEREWRTSLERVVQQSILREARVAQALSSVQERLVDAETLLRTRSREVEVMAARMTEDTQRFAQLESDAAHKSALIDKLQTEIVLAANRAERDQSAAQGSNAVELEAIAVSTAQSSAKTGSIVQVHPEWDFVVTDLGWDTVSLGDLIGIYRGEMLVAQAQVERVNERASAAKIVSPNSMAKINVQDQVKVQ